MGWMTSALAYLGLGYSTRSSATLPASPYATGQLNQIITADIYGADFIAPVGRDQAMSLAPVSRGRSIITGTVGSTMLRVINEHTGKALAADQTPWWMNHTSGVLSAYHRMTWTLDDLIFMGESLWRVQRLPDGTIIDGNHVPYGLWQVTPDGDVEIDGKPVPRAEALYIPGHVEGFLIRGARTLRMALAVERGVEERATSPIPLAVIESKDPAKDLKQKEARAYITAYKEARRAGGGAAAMYMPSYLGMSVYGDRADSGHAIEARNALRLDFANHLGIAASRLEGSQAEAALTYTTQEGDQEELASATGLGPWMDVISARLSQDDVTPPGWVCRFATWQVLEANPDPVPMPADDPAPVEETQP